LHGARADLGPLAPGADGDLLPERRGGRAGAIGLAPAAPPQRAEQAIQRRGAGGEQRRAGGGGQGEPMMALQSLHQRGQDGGRGADRRDDRWPPTPARARAARSAHSGAAGLAPDAPGLGPGATPGSLPCDDSRWPGNTRPGVGHVGVGLPPGSAAAAPPHIPVALARSRGLLSGAFGNTGFEAPPMLSVTIVLRAIAALTAQIGLRRLSPSCVPWTPRRRVVTPSAGSLSPLPSASPGAP
jgi:hypothetical protein